MSMNKKYQKSIANELKNRLSHIVTLKNIDIEKLYEEIFSFFSESPKEYIFRRHKELKLEGYKNSEIFPIISNEICLRLFKGEKLSERQIKRIIYKD